MEHALVGDDVRVLVLSSGKAGHESNCLGVAEALGAPYELRVVAPRRLFAALAPYGPADPRDSAGALPSGNGPLVAIACGRVTAPYLRAIKRAGGRDVFAVFLQDPRYARGAFDLIWTPEHDGLAGANVISTLTSPHPFSAGRLAALRAAPDPRVAALPGPRAAVLLGGPSGVRRFESGDLQRMSEAVAGIVAQGYSVMATPSRRTPPGLIAAVREGLAGAPAFCGFVWDGAGENPYGQMLAHADAILVTGDSVNMIGEAAATGAPVHVFQSSGEGGRIDAFLAGLERLGAVRPYAGRLERFAYAPIDSSRVIAQTIAQRLGARRARG